MKPIKCDLCHILNPYVITIQVPGLHPISVCAPCYKHNLPMNALELCQYLMDSFDTTRPWTHELDRIFDILKERAIPPKGVCYHP